VEAINNSGGCAIIVWDKYCDNPIPNKYLRYKINQSNQIEDISSNLIIYPEIWTDKLNLYSKIKKAIWWLSVDNNKGEFNDFDNDDIIHFCQSTYSLHHLHQKGSKNYLYLNDYISEKYLNCSWDVYDKQNIVCYNPEKGINFTNEIISLNPDINFIPIKGMSEDQIINLLKISKVYIDFGNHPGKDRIPREASLLGNCIITGTSGASLFYPDISIDKKYKIKNLHETRNVILDCFHNYENNIDKFKLYSSMIKNEKNQLFNFVKAYFL